MMRRVLARCAGTAFAVVQYGCIAHCTLEFVGDFAVVSDGATSDLLFYRYIVKIRSLFINIFAAV